LPALFIELLPEASFGQSLNCRCKRWKTGDTFASVICGYGFADIVRGGSESANNFGNQLNLDFSSWLDGEGLGATRSEPPQIIDSWENWHEG
jgi:hypothetical protein